MGQAVPAHMSALVRRDCATQDQTVLSSSGLATERPVPHGIGGAHGACWVMMAKELVHVNSFAFCFTLTLTYQSLIELAISAYSYASVHTQWHPALPANPLSKPAATRSRLSSLMYVSPAETWVGVDVCDTRTCEDHLVPALI